MSNPALIYNGKTISFLQPPSVLQVDPLGPRTINTTLTGKTETLRQPRMEPVVHAEWPHVDGLALRISLENWWQWVQSGGDWAYAHDAAKVIDTLVALDASAGDSAFYVDNPVGIVNGQYYKLIDGPEYQLVLVTDVTGDLVTVSAPVDVALSAGTLFRDPLYFPGVVRDPAAPSPIRYAPATDRQGINIDRFDIVLDFHEDTSQELLMIFKNLPSNAAGIDSAAAQPWLPGSPSTLGSFSLAANTAYRFEGMLRISRAAGTTSHTTALLFGGTCTVTSIAYRAKCNTGDVVTNAAANQTASEVLTAVVVKAASTSATEQISIEVSGTVRVNAAGTFIPQFQFSAAAGGAPTILAGSFFELTPIGSASVVSRGTLS